MIVHVIREEIVAPNGTIEAIIKEFKAHEYKEAYIYWKARIEELKKAKLDDTHNVYLKEEIRNVNE